MTTPSGLTMDAGALIAIERGDRRLRVLLDEMGCANGVRQATHQLMVVPSTTAAR